MKYQMMIRSRPEEQIAAKHAVVKKCFGGFSGDWTIDAQKWPTAKDPGTLPSRQLRLDKCFQNSVVGYVSFRNRKHVRDESKFDDHIALEFHPREVDYSALVSSHFAEIVKAFRAYRGEIGNEEFSYRDGDDAILIEAKRGGVYRVYPVNFWDSELCQRSFRTSPKEIAQRLAKVVERVELIADGVLVVVTSAIIGLQEAEELHRRIRPMLS